MNNPPQNDELLSAYLDGEVTPQEREFMERALQQDPATRQLLEELRTVRSRCRDLPRFALEDSFAQQVLRKAERAILLGDGQLAERCDTPHLRLVAERDDRGAPAVKPSRRIAASRAAWLRVVAALLVLAPALTLMIWATRNGEPDGRIVSQGGWEYEPLPAGQDAPVAEGLGEKGAADESPGGRPEGAALREAEDLRVLDRAKDAGKSLRRADRANAPAPAPPVTESGDTFKPADGVFFGGAAVMADTANGTLVVHVAVTDEAWKKGLGQLLAQHKDVKATELAWRDVAPGWEKKNAPDSHALRLAKLKAAAMSEPAKVGVWNVEASADEMHALLTSLREQAQSRHHVLALAVQPPAQAKDAGAWGFYNSSADIQERERALPPLSGGGLGGSPHAADQEKATRLKGSVGKGSSSRAAGGANMAKQTDDQVQSARGGGKLGAEEMKKGRSSGVAPSRREEAAKPQPSRFFKGGVPPQSPAASGTVKGKLAAPADNKAGIGGGGLTPAGKPAKPPLRDGGGDIAPAAPKKMSDRHETESRLGALTTTPRSRALFIFYVPTSPSPAAAAPTPTAPAAAKK